MRSINDIFADLGVLCRSHGYAHALAFICYKDNFVGYSDELTPEDMAEQFTHDRLIRTEILTLIGLLVRGPIDLVVPSSQQTQTYIDTTYSLLKELHEAMLGDVSEIISKPNAVESLHSGAFLREPIFYGGESAYSFQFRDLSADRYIYDAAWLKAKRGFTLLEATTVMRSLQRRQNERMLTVIKSMAQQDLATWTCLPAFIFDIKDLVSACVLPLEVIRDVLASFSIPKGDLNERFKSVHDFNMITACPFIALDGDKFLLFEQYSPMQALYESPIFWMREDDAYITEALKHRGAFTESFTARRLSKVFTSSRVWCNVRLRRRGEVVGEIDVLVEFAGRIILVQAKSKGLTLEARKGNDQSIKKDFQEAIQRSYDQAFSCAELFLDKEVDLLSAQDTPLLMDRDPIRVLPLCVVADHYPALAIQAEGLLRRRTLAGVAPALILDIFTIDTMTEMLDTPLYLLSYLERRVQYSGKIVAGHELVILANHLSHNLWIENDYTHVWLQDDFTIPLDAAMTVRRDGLPGKRTPDGILTRNHGTSVGGLLRQLERESDPRIVELGLLLLQLSGETLNNLSTQIDRLTELTGSDGEHHDVSLPLGQMREGITIHCTNSTLEVARAKLSFHCRWRKYQGRAERWFGVCLSSGGALRFGLTIAFDWAHDKDMEEYLATRPRTGTLIDMRQAKRRPKIGRNELCPCRSGRKYKKCCGYV